MAGELGENPGVKISPAKLDLSVERYNASKSGGLNGRIMYYYQIWTPK